MGRIGRACKEVEMWLHKSVGGSRKVTKLPFDADVPVYVILHDQS